jgi:hypothetical protein
MSRDFSSFLLYDTGVIQYCYRCHFSQRTELSALLQQPPSHAERFFRLSRFYNTLLRSTLIEISMRFDSGAIIAASQHHIVAQDIYSARSQVPEDFL